MAVIVISERYCENNLNKLFAWYTKPFGDKSLSIR